MSLERSREESIRSKKGIINPQAHANCGEILSLGGTVSEGGATGGHHHLQPSERDASPRRINEISAGLAMGWRFYSTPERTAQTTSEVDWYAEVSIIALTMRLQVSPHLDCNEIEPKLQDFATNRICLYSFYQEHSPLSTTRIHKRQVTDWSLPIRLDLSRLLHRLTIRARLSQDDIGRSRCSRCIARRFVWEPDRPLPTDRQTCRVLVRAPVRACHP